MRRWNAGRSPRGRRERGAVMVEFVLIAPVLVLLIAAIIDLGLTYNDYQAIRSGVRDGARDAVVTNYGSTNDCGLDPSNIPAPASAMLCHVKDRAGLGNAIRVGIWAPGGWVQGATLRVCAQAYASSRTGVMSPMLSGKVVTAKVEMRIEQPLLTGVDFTAAQETALSTWPSSCTGA